MGSGLREGWKSKTLSEIGKVFNGNSINAKVKKENYLDISDGYPYIATKDISYTSHIDYENGIKIPFIEKSSFKIAKKNTILICAEGGSAGRKIGFTNQDICFGNKLFALYPNEKVNNKFIYYFYFSELFQEQFFSEIAGIIGGVSMNKFKSILVSFPPLQEQKNIVAILDEAFLAIEKAKANAQTNLQNAKELFESYLQGVFENRGEGWKEKSLGEVLISPPKNGWSPPAKHQTDLGTPVLTLSSVTGFTFKPESIKYTSAQTNINSMYWVNNGDLLITRSNTPELVGHVAICSNINEPTIYPDLIMKINPNTKMITTEFLFYQLKSLKLRKIIQESAHGANPTMKKINKTDVQSFSITVPPLKTQEKIVKKLNTLQEETKKLESLYIQKLLDLEELKKSLLQKAFNGELV